MCAAEVDLPCRFVDDPAAERILALRKRLGLSRQKFADRFGLDARALQDWEQGRRVPDRAARVLLTVIDSDPEACRAGARQVKEQTQSPSSPGESTLHFVTAQEIPADASGDAGCCGLDGVPGEMGIPGCCLHLGMPEQFPDHGPGSRREPARRESKAVGANRGSARPQGPPACGCAARAVAGR